MAVDGAVKVLLERIAGLTAVGVLDFPLALPVILGEFAVEEEFAHAEYDTIGGRQFSTPAGGASKASQRLRSLPLESLTLDWDAPWLSYHNVSKAFMQGQLERLGRSRRPFSVVATRYGREELRMMCTLRNIRRTLKPGEGDTWYWTLELREYLPVEVDRQSAVKEVGANGKRLPTRATLTNNTTLNSLARSFFGSPTPVYARAIATANGISNWGFDHALAQSRRYKAGDTIKIPVRP